MRKTQRDWLEAGAGILAADGVPALTIERLASGLGVTKGSFYHHFEGFSGYKNALLLFLEEAETLQIIELAEQQATPAEKLSFLLSLIVAGAPDSEIALRGWALQDPDVRAIQARIDARRIGYVQGLCAGLGIESAAALLLSQHLYAILVGAAHIQPPLSTAVLRSLFDGWLALCHRSVPGRM